MPETDPHDAPTETHAGTEAEGHHGGFPPFDPSTFQPQLIWLGLTFVLLYILMSRFALPRIATVLETRQDKIADELDKATSMKKQADDALAAYEKALDDARQRAHTIADAMREKLRLETDALKADLDRRLDAKITEAEARITQTKEAALSNLRAVAVEVTGLVAAKLLGETPDGGMVERAVDSELGGRERSLVDS